MARANNSQFRANIYGGCLHADAPRAVAVTNGVHEL
jgi:hypothetical protein